MLQWIFTAVLVGFFLYCFSLGFGRVMYRLTGIRFYAVKRALRQALRTSRLLARLSRFMP